MKLPALTGNKSPTQLGKTDLQTMLDNSSRAVQQVGGGGGGGGLPLLIYRARGDAWSFNRQEVDPADLGVAVIDFTQIARGVVEWVNKKPRQSKFATIASGIEITEDDLTLPLDKSAYRIQSDGPAVTFQISGAFMDSGDPFRLENSSRGLAGSVRDLVESARSASAAMEEVMHPCITFGSDSYNHAEYGETNFPTFTIVGYITDTVARSGKDITERSMITVEQVEAKLAKAKKPTQAKEKAGAGPTASKAGRRR